jgi:hypothetical protein
MSNTPHQTQTKVYLLRLSRVRRNAIALWLVSLETGSGERRMFTTLEELMNFLERECQTGFGEPPGDGATEG